MSSRSERYRANAEKCRQFANSANSGTKRLYEVMASNWRQLAEEADWTDRMGSQPLFDQIRRVNDKIRQVNFLQQIDKAEDAIRKFAQCVEGESIF